MSRSVIILALTAILAASLAIWGWSEAGEAKGALKDQIALTRAAEARTIKMQNSLRAVEKKYATARQDLEAVLTDVPDRPTPDGVYKRLCARANCTKLESMSAPAD